jgi:hypothetical protein
MIARLHRIPSKSRPDRRWLLSRRHEWHRPGIVRHLNLPTPIPVVDEVLRILPRRRQMGNRAAGVEIHTDPDDAVIEKTQVCRLGRRRRADEQHQQRCQISSVHRVSFLVELVHIS